MNELIIKSNKVILATEEEKIIFDFQNTISGVEIQVKKIQLAVYNDLGEEVFTEHLNYKIIIDDKEADWDLKGIDPWSNMSFGFLNFFIENPFSFKKNFKMIAKNTAAFNISVYYLIFMRKKFIELK